MCGLIGVLGCKVPHGKRRASVHAIAETMVHRGPDGEGVLVPIAESRKVVL
jgi:asparagine synthetase B (glutamine-hydrolysing)